MFVLGGKMKNWFREDGGPAFYGYSNRTSVTGDINIVVWCLVFLTVFLAFLIIFPGIRKEVNMTRYFLKRYFSEMIIFIPIVIIEITD